MTVITTVKPAVADRSGFLRRNQPSGMSIGLATLTLMDLGCVRCRIFLVGMAPFRTSLDWRFRYHRRPEPEDGSFCLMYLVFPRYSSRSDWRWLSCHIAMAERGSGKSGERHGHPLDRDCRVLLLTRLVPGFDFFRAPRQRCREKSASASCRSIRTAFTSTRSPMVPPFARRMASVMPDSIIDITDSLCSFVPVSTENILR